MAFVFMALRIMALHRKMLHVDGSKRLCEMTEFSDVVPGPTLTGLL